MRINLALRYTDYDTKAHINNAIYLTYFEMARAHAWREILGQSDDPPFILAEATVKYLSPAMLGESLEIEMRTTEVRTKAWVWEYAIRCVDDGRAVAKGTTVQVWFDYERRQPVPIPQEMRTRLQSIGVTA